MLVLLSHRKEHQPGRKMEDDQDDIESIKKKFNSHIQDAKLNIKQGLYKEALDDYKKAEVIHSSEKLSHRINKLIKFLEELELCDSETDEEENDLYEEVDGFKIYKECWDKLYPHQKDGVKWFWGLYKEKKGGILGDDMGLGKTIQVIAYMSGMFDQGLVKNAVIVMPKSLMPNWVKEFEKWSPGIRLAEFHGTKAKREKELEKIQRKNGVILTTYGTVSTSSEQFGEHKNQRFIWDYLILDEGHKIKNPNKTSKCVRAIPARNRIILTGTPIQNNLSELWSLIDFVTEGKLLGTKKTFKSEFENPIVRARERDASSYEKRVGNQISETLRKMIEKHLLRRRKVDVFEIADGRKNDVNDVEDPGLTEKDSRDSVLKMDVHLSKKNDWIIWLYMTDLQLKIYKEFLQMDSVIEAMRNKTRSPLAQLTMLKKIADHPRLLSNAVCEILGLSEDTRECEEVLVSESSKLQFVLKLVKSFKDDGHRTLIFSQSRKMLDIVDKVLTKQGVELLRFDGTIMDPQERQALIDKYQSDVKYTCFLLTTQVGAVGLNLTAADRVIIFDPSWNPGNDAQAVDRAYRIGQDKDVIIYRLITCGTIEEKIYRKQIFKDAISKQTTGTCKNPLRYFARNQLRELFILGDTTASVTHAILKELNGEMKFDSSVESHLKFLESLDIFGVSDHNMVYSKENKNTDEAEVSTEYDTEISQRVKRAHDLVTSEVNLCEQVSHLSINEPFQPSKNDIRRYLPNVAKKKTDIEPKKEWGAGRKSIVVPDSPTSPGKDTSFNGHQIAVTSPKDAGKSTIDVESQDSDVIAIEDSFTETVARINESVTINDDDVIEVQPLGETHPSVMTSPMYENKEGILIRESYERLSDAYITNDQYSKIQNDQQIVVCPQDNMTPPRDSVRDSLEERRSPEAEESHCSWNANPPEPIRSPERRSGLKTSTDSVTQNRLLPANPDSDGRPALHQSPIDVSTNGSYAEVVDDMCSPVSSFREYKDTPSPSGLGPLALNQPDYAGTPDSMDPTLNAAFGSMAVASTPNSALAKNPPSLATTSTRKDIRRSAAALIYGLTSTHGGADDSNASNNVSVEVVDVACSPLKPQGKECDSFTEDNSKQVNYVEENNAENSAHSMNLVKEDNTENISSLANRRSDSTNIFGAPDDQRLSFGITRHAELGPADIGCHQCSTPHQERSLPPIEPIPMPEEQPGNFRWSAMVSLQMEEKTGSDGFSNYAGSESLFSNSVNTDSRSQKLDNYSHPGSDAHGDLSTGMQRSSHLATSGSFFSEPMNDQSKNSSKRLSQEEPKQMRGHMERIPESFGEADKNQADLESSKTDERSFSLVQPQHRSLHVAESESDHDSSDQDDENDSEIIVKDKSLRKSIPMMSDDVSNNDDTYYDEDGDYEDNDGDVGDNDDYGDNDSISSNELNMMSLLSGNRSINHGEVIDDDDVERLSPAPKMIGDDSENDSENDSSDSDDGALLRSRKSLRRSILCKPRSSIASANSAESSQSGILCRSGETIDFTPKGSNDQSLSHENTSYSRVDRDQGSFLSDQEAPTQPPIIEEPCPPLFVWDEPFYRRCPVGPSKNCIMDEVVEGNTSEAMVVETTPPERENEPPRGTTTTCPCRKHISNRIQIRRCECVLTTVEREEYRQRVKEATDLAENGNEAGALYSFMKALELADHDFKLQRTVCILAQMVQE